MQRHAKVLVGLAALIGLWGGSAGCTTDNMAGPQRTEPIGPTTSLENPSGIELPAIPVADRTEVDLVEEMMMHRAMYARLLNVLARYYSEHGYENKANWARSELRDLRSIKPYRYITDAEAPDTRLKPMESIAEADRLFQEGRDLLLKGGHHVPIFYNQATMNQALSKFRELVEQYPTSDKVAQAAYYIAEIHKEYNQEKDNIIAIEWYQRAVEWDPNLNHPAWSHAAHVLDFRMHEREKALEWYQKVLVHEKDKTGHQFAGNIKFANERIKQLTPERTRRSPAESTTAIRPEPTGSAEPGEGVEASPAPVNTP